MAGAGPEDFGEDQIHFSHNFFSELRREYQELQAQEEDCLEKIRTGAKQTRDKNINRTNLDSCLKFGLPLLVRTFYSLDEKRSILKAVRDQMRASEAGHPPLTPAVTPSTKTQERSPGQQKDQFQRLTKLEHMLKDGKRGRENYPTPKIG